MSPQQNLWFASLIFALLISFVPPASAQTSLDKELEPYLAQYGLPALAAAVVKNGKIIASGAVGTRMLGKQLPVTLDDRFHLGSNTKAITALLAAILVEAGKLSWDSNMAEVFPELVEKMDEDFRSVTLRQLLTHSSGLPGDNEDEAPGAKQAEEIIVGSFTEEGNLDDLRYWVLEQMSTRPLAAKPGTAFAYANMGYVLAGAMLERVGGRSWEELILDRVFGPLELKTAGFGPQASLGHIDAPLGHAPVDEEDGPLKPFLAGPNGDAPLVFGPSDTVHMSILDFALWAGWNAGEGRRGPHLVRAETLRMLHTPVIDMQAPAGPPGVHDTNATTLQYAFGWIVANVPEVPDPILFHSGSNGKNLAQIWVSPQRDWALVIATNAFTPKALEAISALAPRLFQKYFK